MKRLLPLLIASPILMAFAPHANAAKIAGKAAKLRPHFLKPGAVKSRIVANTVSPIFSIPQAPTSPGSSGTANFSSGSFSSGSVIVFANSGSSIKTSSGTLNISGNGTLTQGSVSLTQGSVANWNGGTLNLGGSGVVVVSNSDPLVTFSGATLTINSNSFTGGTLSLTGGNGITSGGLVSHNWWLNVDRNPADLGAVSEGVEIVPGSATISLNGFDLTTAGGIGTGTITSFGWTIWDGLSGTVPTKSGTGSLTIEGPANGGLLSIQTLAGTSDFEASQTLDSLVINHGAVTTLDALSVAPPSPPPFLDTTAGTSAAVAPVPEPGSTFLLAIGALAVSQVVRRRLR